MNFKSLLFLMLMPGMVCAEIPIPAQIQVPYGNKVMMTVHAKGDQIYQCSFEKGGYSWVLQAPDAQLFDDQGRVVGSHYSGPIWEYKEGSRVAGRVLKKIDVAPATSISWLLVKVIVHKGKGILSEASYINRINTHGGLAPASGCDANHQGGEKRVFYTADYVFYAEGL